MLGMARCMNDPQSFKHSLDQPVTHSHQHHSLFICLGSLGLLCLCGDLPSVTLSGETFQLDSVVANNLSVPEKQALSSEFSKLMSAAFVFSFFFEQLQFCCPVIEADVCCCLQLGG